MCVSPRIFRYAGLTATSHEQSSFISIGNIRASIKLSNLYTYWQIWWLLWFECYFSRILIGFSYFNVLLSVLDRVFTRTVPKATTRTKILPKPGKINFSILINWRNILTGKNHPPKPRPCQKLAKSIFQYLLKKHFNRKKAATKTKILPKVGKISFSILFQLKKINRKKQPPKPRSYQKLEKSFI